jgi:hypothetical protein
MAHRVVIPRHEIDAVIFDMDGVITRTAVVHQAAWKRMFDDFLLNRSSVRGTRFEPFTPEDYRLYVDGKPRQDGVVSFLRSRGITLPVGKPDDTPEMETVHGLGNRKNEYFLRHLREHGVDAYSRPARTRRRCCAPPACSTCSTPGSTALMPPNWAFPASPTRPRFSRRPVAWARRLRGPSSSKTLSPAFKLAVQAAFVW